MAVNSVGIHTEDLENFRASLYCVPVGVEQRQHVALDYNGCVTQEDTVWTGIEVDWEHAVHGVAVDDEKTLPDVVLSSGLWR